MTSVNKARLMSIFLIISVSLVALCPLLCPSMHHSVGIGQAASCFYYFAVEIGLLTTFALCLIGLLLKKSDHLVRDGFAVPPFKPPRLHS